MRIALMSVALLGVLANAVESQTTAPATRPSTTQPARPTKENWQSLKKGMSYGEVVAIMGKPSQVDDLQKGFFGLSPTEDGFLVVNRDRLGRRAVWYLKKNDRLPNLNDVWFSAYFSLAGEKLAAKLCNPPENR